MKTCCLAALACVLLMAHGFAVQEPNCQSMVVPVMVFGADGAQVFTAADFSARSNKKPIAIESVSTGVFPRSTVILLDHSASIVKGRLWDVAQESAVIVAKDSPSGPISLAMFDEKMTQFADIRAALADGKATLELFGPAGQNPRTAIFDSILKTLQSMPRLTPEDSIVVVTDGGENFSKSHVADVKAALRARRVRLIVVLVTREDFPVAPEESVGVMDVADLAQDSGGVLLDVFGSLRGMRNTWSAKDIQEALSALHTTYVQLSRSFRLTISWAPSSTKLEIKAPKVKRPAVLAYPRYLGTCAQPSR